MSLTFEESIILLRKFVKFSEVKNQKHIDLSVAIAEERSRSQKALIIVREAVSKGEITEDQLKEKLGL